MFINLKQEDIKMLRDALGHSNCLYKEGKLNYKEYCDGMFCSNCNRKFTFEMWLNVKEF